MGVAGSGKSVVGSALARALDSRFVEGDQLQPPENVARMASGLPLNDEYRKGWLEAVGREVADAASGGEGVVAACSALKRTYRDRLRTHWPATRFLYLMLDKETSRRRVATRKGHFMPATLVDSQFADLEPPMADEDAMVVDATRPVEDIVAAARSWLAANAPAAG
ncbi:MAG: gluconokinase [Rhizobiaceae bacterium]|nr:gluconokinase [Rhizobiaceae bacterium]